MYNPPLEWRWGYRAYFEDKEPSDNPFPVSTTAWGYWLSGWTVAASRDPDFAFTEPK